jgi:hypothetical protein
VGLFESAMVQFWQGGTPIMKLHTSRTNISAAAYWKQNCVAAHTIKFVQILKVVAGLPQRLM